MKYPKAVNRIMEVMQYILDHENEDFWENPSKDHVYYSAVAFMDGEMKAQNMLTQVLEEQK